MEENNTILDNGLPYFQLALVGIPRNKADNLPADFKNDLMSGKLTPLIVLEIPTTQGKVIVIPIKLQLTLNKDGQPNLMAYPVKKDISEKTIKDLGLSERDVQSLKKGNVLSFDVDGKKNYLQLDPETNGIIRKNENDVKIKHVLNNIDKIKDIGLGLEQKQRAIDGKPIELAVGDTKVSVGVDLKEPHGFKLMKGDMQEWERQQAIKYDIAHPEYVGLVQTDQNRWEYKQIKLGNSQSMNEKNNVGQERRRSGMRL